jgi:hypothetical protein
MIIIFHKRFFELSEEVKKMFLFTETLNLKAASMNKNKRIYNHASQVIKILDKIIILLANSSVNCEDKIKLVELGKRHYHFGLKKEYFKVDIYIYRDLWLIRNMVYPEFYLIRTKFFH